MAAILQFEIDRKRWNATKESNAFHGDGTPHQRVYDIAKTAACDTIHKGGTFVLVVTADKVTMVQRTEAGEI